jgi:hypothetical protein
MIHHNHHIRSVLALALALAAIGAAPAIAMPDNFGIPPSTVTTTTIASDPNLCSENSCSALSTNAAAKTATLSDPNLCSENSCSALAAVSTTGSANKPAPKATHSSGFDWGTAAIIAGGAVILALLAGGVFFATGARRTGRVPRTA